MDSIKLKIRELVAHQSEILSKSQVLYVIGILFLILSFLIKPIDFFHIYYTLFQMFLGFGFLGVINDFVILYKKLWSYVLGKATLLLLFAILLQSATNFALAFSSQIINEITGIIPTNLKYTINFVSILTIPVIAAIASMLIFTLIIGFGFVFMFACHIFKDWKEKPFLKVITPKFDEPYLLLTTFISNKLRLSIFFTNHK